MNVLSLFDGISCGMVALDRGGFKVRNYYAYEVDENAIEVSRDNYPSIIRGGNVFNAIYPENIDLLIGGSPCTFWSIAQSNKTRETVSEGLGWDLFMQYVRALKETNPKYFIYENNFSMSDNIKAEITKQLKVEPIMIDSADFSAQNRKRYYWTNINVDMNFEKSNLVFQDIVYEHDYIERDFSKYANTVRWDKDFTMCKYDTSGKGHYSQQSRCRKTSIKTNTIPASGTDKNNIYICDFKYRNIHPIEVERAQTLPDNYTSCLKSKGKRISLCGNGWTVDVIVYILSFIK